MFNYHIALVNTHLQEQEPHPIELYAKARQIEIRVALKSPSLRMLVDHVSHSEDIALLSSAMSMSYFENRDDVDYLDISRIWLQTRDLETESYYLHCHKGIKPELANCLRRVLTEKLIEMQAHCDQVAQERTPLAQPSIAPEPSA